MAARLLALALCAGLSLLVAAGVAAPAPPAGGQDPEAMEIPRGPFGDSELEKIRQAMLERINFDRELEGVDPVEWDDEAARVGDIFCAISLRDGTVGHYTLDGMSPLDRWGIFGGGGPYVSENTCAWAWSGPTVDWSVRGVIRLLDQFQDMMLAEQPPEDGHRRTILDPHLTHVGIGLALSENQLRYAQEFTSRYVEIDDIPLELERREDLPFSGRVMEPSEYRLDYILLYHKDPPEPLTVAECAQRMSYDLPETRKLLRPMVDEGLYYQSDGSRGEFTYDPSTGEFSTELSWYKGGGWYGVICLLAPAHAPPGEGQFSGSWNLVQVES